MGSSEVQEIERFEEISIRPSNAADAFHAVMKFLRENGFHGEPKYFASASQRRFYAELEKSEKDSFADISISVILQAEQTPSRNSLSATISQKSRISVEFSGLFGMALADYITKRWNVLKIRRKDRTVDSIISFLRGLEDGHS